MVASIELIKLYFTVDDFNKYSIPSYLLYSNNMTSELSNGALTDWYYKLL